jgi:tRNA (guanine37-N1)-methyltransferase
MPETLGNSDSVLKDSFSKGLQGGIEPEAYTRPQSWKELEIPEILLSGHHEKIEEFRQKRSNELTRAWFKKEISDLKEHLISFEAASGSAQDLEDEG